MFAWWPRNIIRNNYRLDPAVPNRNVAIIKIESDKMSSHVSIQHQHNVGSVTSDGIKPHHSHLTPDGCSFNKLIILNNPNLSLSNKSKINQQNSNINHNQSLDGHKRNSRSHRYWCIWCDTNWRSFDSFSRFLNTLYAFTLPLYIWLGNLSLCLVF